MVWFELKLLIASAIAATADLDALEPMGCLSAGTSAIIIHSNEFSKNKRRRNGGSFKYVQHSLGSILKQAQHHNLLFSNPTLWASFHSTGFVYNVD